MSFIDKLQAVASKLQWAKPITLLLMACAVGLFGYIVFGKTGFAQDDQYLLPSVMLLLWSMSLAAFVHTFVHVPEKLGKDHGFFKRFGRGLKRFYYYLLSFALIALTLALIFFTVRAVRL